MTNAVIRHVAKMVLEQREGTTNGSVVSKKVSQKRRIWVPEVEGFLNLGRRGIPGGKSST